MASVSVKPVLVCDVRRELRRCQKQFDFGWATGKGAQNGGFRWQRLQAGAFLREVVPGDPEAGVNEGEPRGAPSELLAQPLENLPLGLPGGALGHMNDEWIRELAKFLGELSGVSLSRHLGGPVPRGPYASSIFSLDESAGMWYRSF
ncbi:hypothetical protein ACIOD0_29550 [Kitasatospora albolonga]